ncbi:MAG: metallophosphoesterase family protein [Gemmatimonadota bacterium]
MRVAALYDIHGNLPALDAVLREVRENNVDHVVVGGDVIPGPMVRECLHRLLTLEYSVSFIRGNGEREVLALLNGVESGAIPPAYRPMMRWVGGQLSEELQQAIAAWPATTRLSVAGVGDVLFCHATPRSDSEIFLRTTPNEALLPVFADTKAAVVVCGHTHMQFDRYIGGVRVVNAGSVGMPFGEPGAYWLLLGPNVEPKVTPYDLEAAADAVRATEYLQREEFAARAVLRPPTEEQMLAAFSRAEIRREG